MIDIHSICELTRLETLQYRKSSFSLKPFFILAIDPSFDHSIAYWIATEYNKQTPTTVRQNLKTSEHSTNRLYIPPGSRDAILERKTHTHIYRRGLIVDAYVGKHANTSATQRPALRAATPHARPRPAGPGGLADWLGRCADVYSFSDDLSEPYRGSRPLPDIASTTENGMVMINRDQLMLFLASYTYDRIFRVELLLV